MKSGIPAQTNPQETRHAASPLPVKALIPAGRRTGRVQPGAAGIADRSDAASALF